MHSDPLADLLTRIRNAQMAQHKVVNVPASNLKKEVTKILFDQGFILNYKFVDAKPQGTIKIALRYDDKTRRPAITEVKRFSKPGLRKYGAASELPRVLNGLGISIISTNKGLMTDKEARRLNIGGEIICTVY
jgi:small subunit ribosomal protein S8